jgi:hypothetical protein
MSLVAALTSSTYLNLIARSSLRVLKFIFMSSIETLLVIYSSMVSILPFASSWKEVIFKSCFLKLSVYVSSQYLQSAIVLSILFSCTANLLCYSYNKPFVLPNSSKTSYLVRIDISYTF